MSVKEQSPALYLVLTSDGVFHETRDGEEYVKLLDKYGPEVVESHAIPFEDAIEAGLADDPADEIA